MSLFFLVRTPIGIKSFYWEYHPIYTSYVQGMKMANISKYN